MTDASVVNRHQAGIVAPTADARTVHQPVPIHAVTMKPGFWDRRIKANHEKSIPQLFDLFESHGVLHNFRRMVGLADGDRYGPLFTDSDLYKWMEAVAFVLQSTPDAQLEAKLDDVIDLLQRAQRDDGYLNTWYVDDRYDQRFTNLAENHELYCAGHLFQAAVAHYRTTGKASLLNIATRFADYLCSTFGPDQELQGAPGHPEIEMALIELYRTTGKKEYLRLAGYFLDENAFTGSSELAGHAVRQMYLCAGAADYYQETGDAAYLETNRKLWHDLVSGKMYVTGGVGSRHVGEAFGDPFELPNYRSYTETCAAIGNVFWNYRLLLATGEARFADVMERALYNGFLAGVSLAGTEYFYVNPLASHEGAQRADWYDCTCCPPNIQRMLASLPGYVFSTSASALWVHLYDNCQLDWQLGNGQPLRVSVETAYPWDQDVQLTIDLESAATFALKLRIPGWARSAKVLVNSQQVEGDVEPGGYCSIERQWQPGDRVHITLPMSIRCIIADERLAEAHGRVAVSRGPLIYCFEAADHPGISLEQLRLCLDQKKTPMLHESLRDETLGGVVRLVGKGVTWQAAGQQLYQFIDEAGEADTRPAEVTAIPYYAWANRRKGPMTVWVVAQRQG